jgi:hypothetical protein
MLHHTRLKKLARYRHSNWLDLFVILVEIKVFCIWHLLASLLTKLYIFYNLQLGPISYSVPLHWMEMFARYKHSNLLGLFLSLVEIKVFWIWHQLPYLQIFVFFAIYNWDHLARMLHHIRLKKLARYKHSNLLGLFVILVEIKVFWIWPQLHYWQNFL